MSNSEKSSPSSIPRLSRKMFKLKLEGISESSLLSLSSSPFASSSQAMYPLCAMFKLTPRKGKCLLGDKFVGMMAAFSSTLTGTFQIQAFQRIPHLLLPVPRAGMWPLGIFLSSPRMASSRTSSVACLLLSYTRPSCQQQRSQRQSQLQSFPFSPGQILSEF